MREKEVIRKNFLKIRKKNYFEIKKSFFQPLINLIKKKFNNRYINIGLFYPSFFEVNVLKIFEIEEIVKNKILLPKIEKKNSLTFNEWKKKEVLTLNNFGILEPLKSNPIIPDLLLVPLIAYDNKMNRLGYGKGFYDRFLNKSYKKNNKIITVGVAFSFQRHHKLPISKNDIKLDFILTEKGLVN